MSHYARTIKPLDAHTVATGERVTLGLDTPIKRVQLIDGVYHFEAHTLIGNGRDKVWLVLNTEEDLPAFTDKGAAHRAKPQHATLRKGRPLAGTENTVRPIAFRPTPAQREWIETMARRGDKSVSEWLRARLVDLGMPS